MKINFNYKSAKAWGTLASAIIAGIISILTALGITVPADTASLITGIIGAILSLLSATGILTVKTDNHESKTQPLNTAQAIDLQDIINNTKNAHYDKVGETNE